MGLSIRKLSDGLYEASATPPHVSQAWNTSSPLAARDLVRELLSRGCHQQDIGDAMHSADPDWVSKT